MKLRATKDRVEDITARGPILSWASETLLRTEGLSRPNVDERQNREARFSSPHFSPLTPVPRCSWSKKTSKIRQVRVRSARPLRFEHHDRGERAGSTERRPP